MSASLLYKWVLTVTPAVQMRSDCSLAHLIGLIERNVVVLSKLNAHVSQEQPVGVSV